MGHQKRLENVLKVSDVFINSQKNIFERVKSGKKIKYSTELSKRRRFTERFFKICFKIDRYDVINLKYRLIDWIEFYDISAIFQPCNGGNLT